MNGHQESACFDCLFFIFYSPSNLFLLPEITAQLHCLHGSLLGSDTKIWWCGQGGGRVFGCWKRCLINYVNTNALGTSLVAQMVKNLPTMQETWVRLLDGKDPLEKEMATHSSGHYLETCMDRGAWQATVHGVTKSQNDWVTNIFTCTHTHTHTHTYTRITLTLKQFYDVFPRSNLKNTVFTIDSLFLLWFLSFV